MSYHNFKEVLINCDQYLANYARKKYYAPETPYVVIPHIVFVGRPEDYCRSVVGKPNKSQPHFVAKMQFSRSFTARYAVLQFLENEFLNDFLYFVNYHMSKYRFTKAKAIRNFCHTFEITEDDIAHDTLVKRFDRANKKKNFQWLKKA